MVRIPNVFENRREITGGIGNANQKIGQDLFTYYSFGTNKNEIISSSLRFLSPFCQFAFWWSGMYEGGKFNRNYIESAASLQIPFTLDPVKSITRSTFPVPDKTNNSYSLPVVIFTPISGSAPYPILVFPFFRYTLFCKEFSLTPLRKRFGTTGEDSV